MSTLKIASFMTKHGGYSKYMVSLMKKNNLKLDIIGYDCKWKGWYDRSKNILNYLKNQKKDDIIILIDSYDIMVVSDKDEIIDKYHSFGKKIVFSANNYDKNNGITYNFYLFLSRLYFNCANTKGILNMGSIIGECSELIKLYENVLKYMLANKVGDDQRALNNINLDQFSYAIDFKSDIFYIWTISSLKEVTTFSLFKYSVDNKKKKYDSNGRIILPNKAKPCIIHGICNKDLTFSFSKFNIEVSKKDIKKKIYQKDIRQFIIFAKIFSITTIVIRLIYKFRKNKILHIL